MKNIDRSSNPPVRDSFTVPAKGLPLRGWTLRYVSGRDETEAKPGDWLSEWSVSGGGTVVPKFESHLKRTFFDNESQANHASDELRQAGVETRPTNVV